MHELDQIRATLDRIGQSHVLAFFDELDTKQRTALLAQLETIDLDRLPEYVERYVRHDEAFVVPEGISPAPYYPNNPANPSQPWDEAEYRAVGEKLLRKGKVACFTVAGGQGSRLGYDGPKGCFPIGPISEKPLFQIFAEGILATGDRFGVTPPWAIMTSPLNHAETKSFFKKNNHFGLDPKSVTFFMQGVMPSFDKDTGKMLLAQKHQIATNPDGHGGSLKALEQSGTLADLRAKGIEHISYFQVDNPHVHAADPVFLGLHAAAPGSSGQMSSKMIPKVSPDEKVGVFCAVDGRVQVIEYSDLPRELQEARKPDGSLRFLAGSIAIHAISVEFIEKINSDPAYALPFHRAIKKVNQIDLSTGEMIDPAEPNAVKLERFIFDAVPMADASMVYETDRVEEFAPVKNATGVDSVESSKALQIERAARWLEAAGVKVPRTADGTPDCVIELSLRTANSPEALKAVSDLPTSIEPGARVSL